ncbi:DUF748 domain-containing protein [Desulfuromonas sp.]|uniref:DUF748 domain-containing protein n=1 Tax=Desulfuromonas sp. TaxID=892 RepID=UPI0025BFCD26|nr:DUF748 domain-containing protein [Desulfuromonas sp.]
MREERKGEKPAVQETGGGQPWDYRVGRIAGGGWQIAFRDELPGGKPAFNLSGLEFALENLAGPRPAESPFRLAATYGRRGGVELSGQAVLAEPKVKGTIRLKGLPLPDFAPYLPEKVRAELAGGLLYATLELDVLAGGKELQATFGGDLMVRDFLLLDGRRRADLLRFGTLQIDGVRGTAAPFSLEVATVALSDYAAKVAIDEEGRVNLQDIVAAGEEPAQETPPGEEAAAGPPPEISIGAITLQGGTVDFSDRQVRPSFATTMVNLGGRVSGLSSAPGTLAEVDLRGNLENQAPLSITGRIHPLGEPFFLDLKVSFHGIELTPTTPYSGTFLGYTIDKGKLDLDLAYRVEEKNLEARNKVFLDQFTLGGRVKSEKATGLPVKLAVALLKDRRGEIRLDLPVTGRTDDPKFSIFSVVLKILKNLLVKAATSPLALLQVAFGGGDSDFSSVVFPPGSSNLTPPEEEKLRRLATAFQDRPALRLEVKGFFDPERDPEGYRRNLLEQKMRQEKFLHLVKEKQNLPGQTAADLEIAPEERSGYLEAVYKKADFPKPRGFFGIAKKLPDAEMEKLILASTPVGPDEMAQVARSRAVRVMNFLVAEGGLPKERLFLTRPPDAAAPPKTKGADRSRVELGVSAK